MAAVNFPTPTDLNPSTGQTFAEGWYNPDNGVTYVHENNVWSAAKTPSQSFDDRYVEVTGDNMTGALTLGPNGGPAVTTLAADGSASFAGNVFAGSNDPNANPGVVLEPSNGQVSANRVNYYNGFDGFFSVGYNAGNPVYQLYSDGSASFAGDKFEVTATGSTRHGVYDNGAGIWINSPGYIEVSRADGDVGDLWSGKQNLTETSSILSDGSAAFAGQMQIGGDIATTSGTRIYNNGALYLRSDVGDAYNIFKYYNGGFTDDDVRINFKGDGSAEFAGSITASNVTFNLENGPTLDVKERLESARETFEELKVAVQNATDFGELKAAMLVALEDY